MQSRGKKRRRRKKRDAKKEEEEEDRWKGGGGEGGISGVNVVKKEVENEKCGGRQREMENVRMEGEVSARRNEMELKNGERKER